MVNKTAVVVVGRFNPPTKGHQYLINYAKDYAKENGYDFYLLPTRTQGNAKNPIPHKDKLVLLKELFPDVNIVDDSYVHHLHDLIEMLKCYGYEHFVGIGDEERRNYYERIENLDYISLGERKEDSIGILAISATKAREAAKYGDIDGFLSYMPKELSLKRLDEVYNKIREFNNEDK